MPTVLRLSRYRFHFYSNEGNEPAHIHVDTPEGECKFWLGPVELAKWLPPQSASKVEKYLLIYTMGEL